MALERPRHRRSMRYDDEQKLLDELGLSLRVLQVDAANLNKSEWNNITRPETLRCYSRGIQANSASCRSTALCCHQRGCIIHITSSWRLGIVGNMQA